jgi:excisionase family DNA binding protein
VPWRTGGTGPTKIQLRYRGDIAVEPIRPDPPPPAEHSQRAVAEKPLMTAKEAATALRVSTATVYRLIDAGLITCVPNGRSLQLDRASVEKLHNQPDQTLVSRLSCRCSTWPE